MKVWTAALKGNAFKFWFTVYTPKIASHLAMIFIVKFMRQIRLNF